MLTVWLNGPRRDVCYRYATGDGRVLRTVALRHPAGPAAGWGRWCCGRFAAVYVDPADRCVLLQAGECRYPLDDPRTRLYVRDGATSRLHVWHPVAGGLVLRDLTPGPFLRDVYALAADRPRRDALRAVIDPAADPTRGVAAA